MTKNTVSHINLLTFSVHVLLHTHRVVTLTFLTACSIAFQMPGGQPAKPTWLTSRSWSLNSSTSRSSSSTTITLTWVRLLLVVCSFACLRVTSSVFISKWYNNLHVRVRSCAVWAPMGTWNWHLIQPSKVGVSLLGLLGGYVELSLRNNSPRLIRSMKFEVQSESQVICTNAFLWLWGEGN